MPLNNKPRRGSSVYFVACALLLLHCALLSFAAAEDDVNREYPSDGSEAEKRAGGRAFAESALTEEDEDALTEKRGGGRAFVGDKRGGGRAFVGDKRGGGRGFQFGDAKRGGGRAFQFAGDKRGGGRAFLGEKRGGGRAFLSTDNKRGGGRAFSGDKRGGGRGFQSFGGEKRGGGRNFMQFMDEKRGGGRGFVASFNDEKRGGGRIFVPFNDDKRGGGRYFIPFNDEKRGGARPFATNYDWKRAGGRYFDSFLGYGGPAGGYGYEKRGGGRAFQAKRGGARAFLGESLVGDVYTRSFYPDYTKRELADNDDFPIESIEEMKRGGGRSFNWAGAQRSFYPDKRAGGRTFPANEEESKEKRMLDETIGFR